MSQRSHSGDDQNNEVCFVCLCKAKRAKRALSCEQLFFFKRAMKKRKEKKRNTSCAMHIKA